MLGAVGVRRGVRGAGPANRTPSAPFEVIAVRREEDEREVRLAASLRRDEATSPLWFATADPGAVATRADPFLPVLLFPAMRAGAPVRVEGAIGRALREALERIQHVRLVWDPESSPVAIEATALVDEEPGGTGIGAFFSGGVDSFYTLRRRRDVLTHLILVQGFDVPLAHGAFFAQVREHVAAVARALDLGVVVVRTNLREFTGRYVSWDDAHGAALAAVAHFLAPRFRRIYVPASYALPFLVPHGSHPGLDPLWSTPAVEIAHDGAEATRFDKVQALADWEPARRHLRVCWQRTNGAYNCGRCRKCLWTMAFLRACGALERATTFPPQLDLEALRRHPPEKPDELARVLQAWTVVARRGDDLDLAACLAEAIAQARNRRGVRSLPRRLGRRLAAVLGASRR